ncbi:MAG: tyrosine-type recombinase/integrase [Oscillospiraceae bacterium]|nr:tyrosine-type recombinase/integrase [Oscillospiraceae bacterium]
MTTEYLVNREMEHVLAALTPANRLVCRVCVATGLRVGDVVALRSDQLARQFWITEAKTGKRRRVNLTDGLLKALQDQAGKAWVFPSPKNETRHRTRQAVWYDVKRASKAFRLPQNVAPHSLRKVYAVDLMKRCKGNVGRVQRALNHSDMATTMVYVMAYQLYRDKYIEDAA